MSLRNRRRYLAAQSVAPDSPSFEQIRDLAQAGDIWVDHANDRTFEWDATKCSEFKRTIVVYTLVVESFKKIDLFECHKYSDDVEDYAFLGESVKQQMAYKFSLTRSTKRTYFFVNEKNRQWISDVIGQFPAGLASKALNEAPAAKWFPLYKSFGDMCADEVYREMQLAKMMDRSKYFCMPFVRVSILGKHRRQDRTRHLVFEKPAERLEVALKRSKQMFSAQSKGKRKKAFTEELWRRVERMLALWPERMPTWAPFLETCLMLELKVAIVTI
jgi:hypothetical protein